MGWGVQCGLGREVVGGCTGRGPGAVRGGREVGRGCIGWGGAVRGRARGGRGLHGLELVQSGTGERFEGLQSRKEIVRVLVSTRVLILEY